MLWYPYTQMKTMQPPIPVDRAEGVYLYTPDGPLIDAVSSWWSTIHGYAHPVLNKAITDQLQHFSHIMLGGLTHQPAQKLADRLQALLPGDLDHCFFSDSGSVAVEIALKIALQYRTNTGSDRRSILALKNAYHGDTFKCMEVGDDEDYHFAFSGPDSKKDVHHIPTQVDALKRAFHQYGETLSAFIVEPLLQGAGGMLMYDISFLQEARRLCDQYDVLLIFDEVATGFGRTGHRFVADLVQPDILVLGKALTGGYLGHAATIVDHKVFNAFYTDDPRHALMHGPTFMANALACSVALASIDLFEKENYLQKIARIEALARNELDRPELHADPRIKDIRIMGGCLCIETTTPAVTNGFAAFARKRGIFFRPFKNCLYAMVPYIITDTELLQVTDTMRAWFD